jgi:hypothetical protein
MMVGNPEFPSTYGAYFHHHPGASSPMVCSVLVASGYSLTPSRGIVPPQPVVDTRGGTPTRPRMADQGRPHVMAHGPNTMPRSTCVMHWGLSGCLWQYAKTDRSSSSCSGRFWKVASLGSLERASGVRPFANARRCRTASSALNSAGLMRRCVNFRKVTMQET